MYIKKNMRFHLKKENFHKLNGLKMFYSLIVAILACILIIGTFSCLYLKKMQEVVKSDSINYLQEVSKQVNINVKNMITMNVSALETVNQIFQSQKYSTIEQVMEILVQEKKRWGFSQISIVDEQGKGCCNNGIETYIGLKDNLQKDIDTKEYSIFPVIHANGKSDIAFVCPIKELNIENKKFKMIIGTYDIENLNSILSLKAFEGNGYAHIINKDGTVMIRSNHPLAEQKGENLVRILSMQKIDKGNSIEQFVNDLRNNRTGFIGYTMNGIHKYMTYIPVEIQDWYLLSIVPAFVVDTKSNELFKMTALICFSVTFIFCIIFVIAWNLQLLNKKKLEQIAYEDDITDGKTQGWFEQNFQEILFNKLPHETYCMIYANVQKFKLINDREGRKGGDRLLREVNEALSSILMIGEIMCRLSADHFALLLKYNTEENLKDRLKKAQLYLNSIAVGANQKKLGVKMTFGVYIIKSPNLDLTTMLDRANIARINIIKSSGKDMVYRIYDDTMRYKMLREKELEEKMMEALDRKEFVVYLQPKVELTNETVIAAEALVRWKGEEGIIFPDEFIPLFEKNGFIAQLDLYVFEIVCCLLRKWIEEEKPIVTISVNLSKVNLEIPNFFQHYEAILKREKVPPEYIEFEFTETTVYDNTETLAETIDYIHSIGCVCSMDDFGSSYSSLNLLKDVDVDILKLDKAFFRETARLNHRDLDIVEGIVEMAKKIHLKTVAEGVEQAEQIEFLKKIKCDMVQGFYYAKPMPIENFETFILEYNKNK